MAPQAAKDAKQGSRGKTDEEAKEQQANNEDNDDAKSGFSKVHSILEDLRTPAAPS